MAKKKSKKILMSKADMDAMIKLLETIFQKPSSEVPLLKGHLLIEEVLDKIIIKNAHNPKYVEKARLRFYDKIFLARAFSKLEKDKWLWESIKALNEARNSLGHNLDRRAIKEKINNFIGLVEPSKNLTPDLITERFTRLHWAISYVYIALAAHANFNPADYPSMPTFLTGKVT